MSLSAEDLRRIAAEVAVVLVPDIRLLAARMCDLIQKRTIGPKSPVSNTLGKQEVFEETAEFVLIRESVENMLSSEFASARSGWFPIDLPLPTVKSRTNNFSRSIDEDDRV